MTTSQITIVNKIPLVMNINKHRFIEVGNFGEAFSGSSLSILILLFASSGDIQISSILSNSVELPSITDGVHRNENFVAIIPVFSTFSKFFKKKKEKNYKSHFM